MNATKPKLPSIVFVEDEPYMRMLVSYSLEENFTVTSFDNGLDALTFLQEGNIPDVMVLDLNTPKLDGHQLLMQLKSSGFFNAIPVIILSGEESTQVRIKCLEAGAEDYMLKPFNPRELEVRINAILKRSGKIFNE